MLVCADELRLKEVEDEVLEVLEGVTGVLIVTVEVLVTTDSKVPVEAKEEELKNGQQQKKCICTDEAVALGLAISRKK